VKWRTNLENHPTINPELAEIKLSSVNAWTRKDTKGRNIEICGQLGAVYKKSPVAERKQHESSLQQRIGMVWSKWLQNILRKNKSHAYFPFTHETRKALRPHDTFK
jgi:hypothetical protein